MLDEKKYNSWHEEGFFDHSYYQIQVHDKKHSLKGQEFFVGKQAPKKYLKLNTRGTMDNKHTCALATNNRKFKNLKPQMD